MTEQKIAVKADGIKRLDVLFCEAGDLTRSRIEQLIREGNATVDGRVEFKPGLKPRDGANLQLLVPEDKPADVVAQDIPLHIFYEDDDLAVVEKPCGMVVHPAAGNQDGTLVNALLHHLKNLSGIGGVMRPGIVHRLDKDTSGLLLVAKHDAAHVELSRQLKEREMEKHYLAVVEGTMKQDCGRVDAPIARSKLDRKSMAVDPLGRPAVTEWCLVEELKGGSLLDVHLITGRTHQIRVHMAHIHHPVAGDPIYGLKHGLPAPRLMLHAQTLAFTHPKTGERMCFEAPVPEAFATALIKWKK
jgi:23S rRNA pseudouridine1911/1915/1917 synthase